MPPWGCDREAGQQFSFLDVKGAQTGDFAAIEVHGLAPGAQFQAVRLGGIYPAMALNHATASRLADRLSAIPGVELLNQTFFNEFTLKLPKAAAPVVEALAKKRILGGVPVSRLYPDDAKLANLLLVAATETVSDDDIAAYEAALKEVLK